MSEQWNNGTVQYASRELSIQTSLTSTAEIGTYVADNINVNRPTKLIQRTDHLGEPSGSVGVADFVTGTATLQLADSNAKEPQAGNVFSATFDATISTETFIVHSVGRSETKDGEKKINVSFIKKYGA